MSFLRAAFFTLLASTTATAAELKLATLTLNQVGLSPEKASFFTEYLSGRLSAAENVRVVSPADVAAVLGMERQRQLLGCDDSGSSCVAELAGALGVDALVSGQIAKVGTHLQLTVKVVASENGKRLYVHTSDLLDDEEDVVRDINRIANEAVERSRQELARMRAPTAPAEVVAAPAPSSGRAGKITLMVAGAVLLLGGGGCLLSSKLDLDRLRDRSLWDMFATTGEAEHLRDSGSVKLLLGVPIATVGAALLVTGLLWVGLSGSSAEVSAWVTPTSAGLALGGSL